MKIFAATATALALLAAPTFAFAQSSMQQRGTDTSPNAAPGSATSPMHTTHDKGAATAVDNNNGIYSGRSSSDQPKTGLNDATTGTH